MPIARWFDIQHKHSIWDGSLKMEIKFFSARAHILSSFAIRRFSGHRRICSPAFYFSLVSFVLLFRWCETKKGFNGIFAIHIGHIARSQWLISDDRMMCIAANCWDIEMIVILHTHQPDFGRAHARCSRMGKKSNGAAIDYKVFQFGKLLLVFGRGGLQCISIFKCHSKSLKRQMRDLISLTWAPIIEQRATKKERTEKSALFFICCWYLNLGLFF